MNYKFQYQGLWWLPGASERSVPGTLKFNPNEGTTLELMGSLNSIEENIAPIEPDIILGISSDGQVITLKDCWRTRGSLPIGRGFATSTFIVDTIFIGKHFEQPEDIGFERLIVEYLHLDAWADISGFEIEFHEETEEPKKRWTEIKHQLPEPYTAIVEDEYEVTLDFGSDFKASQRPFTWTTIKQPAEIAIKFSVQQPFDFLLDIAFRIQHLLSLGMRSSAYPVTVRGYTGLEGKVAPVEVYYKPLGRMDNIKRPERHEMLFLRGNLPGGFETAVGKWLVGAEKLDPVYRLFLGTVYNPRSYIEQRFLNLVQALEVYHRRILYAPDPSNDANHQRVEEIVEAAPEEHKSWLQQKLQVVNEPSLNQKLHEIFKKHLNIVNSTISKKKQARAEFIEKVVATRNYRTHFDDRKKDKAARGEELYQMMKKLNLLLEACLMEEVGFASKEIENSVLGKK